MTGRVPALPRLDRASRRGDTRTPRRVSQPLSFLLVGLLSVGCSSAGDMGTASPDAPTTSSVRPEASPAGPSTTASTVPDAQPTVAAAEPVTVTIKDFSYAIPGPVPAGSTVQVRNDDGEAHTVTLKGGAVQLVVQGAGRTASFTAPAEPGRYPVVCDFHGNMTAELVVV